MGSRRGTVPQSGSPEPVYRAERRYLVGYLGAISNEPWLWPEVWQANPQIENPDLIFPGDEIMLSFQDGRPIIRVRRRGRRGTTYLSPSVRAENLAREAIPTIPFDAIHQFLTRPRVVTEIEFDDSPYILSVGAEALSARPGSKVFARGLRNESAKRYGVYRKGVPYVDPVDGEVLGFEAVHVADAAVEAQGDPVTLVITSVYREVLVGDRLIEISEDEVRYKIQPHPVAAGLAGQIISVVDGVSQIGQYQTVVLNLGARDGLEVGHVFAVFQSGAIVEDPLAKDPVYEERARQRAKERARVDGTAEAFVYGLGHAVESTSDWLGRGSKEVASAATGTRPWSEACSAACGPPKPTARRRAVAAPTCGACSKASQSLRSSGMFTVSLASRELRQTLTVRATLPCRTRTRDLVRVFLLNPARASGVRLASQAHSSRAQRADKP